MVRTAPKGLKFEVLFAANPSNTSDMVDPRVIEMWNAEGNTSGRYGKGYHWVEAPQVVAYIQSKMSGHSSTSWGQHLINNYLSLRKGSYRGASLGCGTGQFEVDLQKQGIFEQLDAFDAADHAITQARSLAASEGVSINFVTTDLNACSLESNTYDVVIANSSLHHLSHLEHVIEQVKESLVPGGILAVCEYVGPSQFQYPASQVQIINELLSRLPLRLRRSVTVPGKVKQPFAPPSIEYMLEHDPSEAIRSAEIVTLLENAFVTLEKRPFGGTILHMLLQDIAGNFDPHDEYAAAMMSLLIYVEQALLDAGAIQSDFIYMVLQRQ